MAELRATPMVNPVMGLLADRLKKVQQFGAKPFGYENPPVEMLMNLLGVPAVQQTMERMAYGEPLTTGRGMTTKPRPEAIEAALTLLPASVGAAKVTKGLPVGASIKSIDDIVAKYPDVTIDASVGKKDINLSRIVVPKEMRNQGVGTQVMNDLSEYADSIGKRITLTPSNSFGGSVPKLKAFYKELGFVENKGKNKDFSTREAMYREPQAVDAKPSYPQQEALDTAQRNAALPIEEGGLGLPKDNTPEMRAKAMGFDLETYHGTNDPNISAIDINKSRPDVQYMQGFFTSDDPNVASNYGDILMPFLQQKGTTVLERRAARQAGLEVPAMDTIYDKEKNILVTNNPSNIRSRFAAFDPMRRNEPDILAGVLPLGLLADEEQRKKLYELMPSLLGQ